MQATYANPWHNPANTAFGPAFYSTDAAPVEHAGHLIYERVMGRVWDVVLDGVCVTQMAGPNGAKRAAEARAA